MREILFKAKRIDNGEWVVGQYVNTCYPGNDKETGHFIVVYPNEYHEIYTSTICQFTGLCDKNGKRIWENDIIQYGAVAAVVNFGEYGNGNLGFYVDFPEETNYRKDFSYWAKKVVVIGNAVDDRSLLQEVLE